MKKYASCFQEIYEVEIERESESCVWRNGKRHPKHTDFRCYHDTFDQAKDHIIRVQEERIKRAKAELSYAEGLLQKAQQLKQPTL